MTEPEHEVSEPRQRYSLRESSKLTPKYRDYVDQQQVLVQQQHSAVGSSYQQIAHQAPTIQRSRGSTPKKQLAQKQFPVQTTAAKASYSLRRKNVVKEETYEQQEQHEQEMEIGAEQEVSTSAYEPEVERPPPTRPAYRLPPHERRYTTGADLSNELKVNLRKLKNMLKLPKARRFVFCEFFYSGVDQQLFLMENEFSQLMRESFPNVKTIKLRRPEWREVRRLIGKPRRCSQAFLNEEREALEAKRQKIRQIYNGTCTSFEDDPIDLPANLPRHPIVGQKIYARVRSPKDGIYAATVDAITDDGYRVVFEKDDQLPPTTIKDYEVMCDQPMELLSINYFMEQNRAKARGNKTVSAQFSQFYPTQGGFSMDGAPRFVGGTQIYHPEAEPSPPPKKVAIAKDEKVGNFPVRMLVILVKLCKVVEYKKQLVGQLTMMNDCAEKLNLLSSGYPYEFKVQFAQLVIDLETVNRLFRNYLSALQTHYNTLLPHLNEPKPTDRPEVLRKTCNTHAYQIVKHCNSELNVRNKRMLHLITSLASITLQLRTIGASKKKFNSADMNILSESLKQIRTQISPSNAAAFQDHVEVHMKQILKMMSAAKIG